MAKVKTYAVEVEITTRHTLFVDARRPNGAVEKLNTRDGWLDATRYTDDDSLTSIRDATDPNVAITKIRDLL